MVISAENANKVCFAFHRAIQRIKQEGDTGYLIKEVVSKRNNK